MRKRISELVIKIFYDFWRAAFSPHILNVVAKGGRGSAKSSHISHAITQLLIRYAVNAVGIRRIDNTIEQSIYEQMKWAIEEQGVAHLFKCSKNPYKITYLPRGNYMIFRGAKDPERIHSLKDSKFPFAICWIEELREFKREEDVTNITNSILRAELDEGLFYKLFFSYNPPKKKQSWVNKKYESTYQPKNTYVHHSTYLDNPFIASAFIDEANNAKDKNKNRYDWEYLGKAIGSGVVPFDNLEVIANSITDEMVVNFDNIRNGLDFGYSVDPLAYVRWHYDKKKNCIYAVDEFYGQKISNRSFAKWFHSKGYSSEELIADAAEPKSIAEIKNEHNVPHIKGAYKGPDSVEYGERWLDDLDAIYIDPVRTPNIAAEFENIDYQVDKDGDPKPRLEDKDNHTIDATRYAFSNDMKSRKGGVSVWK